MLSVSQVCDLQPGDEQNASWINPGFAGVVQAITSKKTKAGKNFWPCVIADVNEDRCTIEMSLFTAPKFRAGDLIEVFGKGLRRTEYNGNAQATMGRETQIEVTGGRQERREVAPRAMPPRDDSRGGNGGEPPPHDEAHAAAAALAKVSHLRINGQTVGMAMKEALAVLTSGLTHDEVVERLIAPSFWASVHEVASDIIRVSTLLEAGNLAKPIKDRAPEGEAVQY